MGKGKREVGEEGLGSSIGTQVARATARVGRIVIWSTGTAPMRWPATRSVGIASS
jgi:hypothetical protein